MVFFGGHCAEQAAPHDHYRLLRSRGVPTVLMNAAIDNLDFPRVSTDDVTAAGQAYTHLASLGHQRIGLVLGPEDHVPSRRKLAGFTAQARRAPENSPVEHALFSLEGGQAATDPPLTTVRQPIESMGKAAVALLVNQIENTDVYPEELLFEPELVVRGSTGRPGTGTAVARFTSLLHAIRTRVGASELQDASPRPSGGLTTVRICGMCNFCEPAQAGAMHDSS